MDTIPKTREDLLVEIAHLRDLLEKAKEERRLMLIAAALQLRDKFAMHAPISGDTIESAIEAVLQRHSVYPTRPRSRSVAGRLAEWAYRYADAMLVERERKP